jgi:hypothetical protein
MLFPLTATTDKIQLVTSAAGTLDVVASYVDAPLPIIAGSTMTPGRQLTAITTAATTDVLAAPAASTVRGIKAIHVRNKSTTVATDVTVLYNANGTTYEAFKCNLDTGESLEYVEGVGFYEINNTSKLDKVYRVTTDYVNATTSFTAITGLAAPVEAGKLYMIDAYLIRITNATTTGAQFAIGNVAMTAMVLGEIGVTLSAAAGSTMAGGAATAVDTAIVAETTGPATNAPAHIGGMINPSASGTVQLKGASEVAVAAGLTVRAGSWMHIRELDN